ncbi:MAG: SRPBCC family protein [Candidatus Acidiferrum sp.]
MSNTGEKMAKDNQTTIIVEPGKQEVFISREFEAPRELVFRAYSDPKLLTQWLGPRDLKMTVQQFDARSGGSYRYTHTRGSHDYKFHGVIHELTAPERIIQTFEFEGFPEPGHVALETTRFEALPGRRTRVNTQSVFQSVADRDSMAESGMKRGVEEGHERLTGLLEALKKK